MVDSTLPLLLKGYAWLPDRRRRSGGAPVRTRLLGKKAIALHGPAAVRFFYDEKHIRRHEALPQPVIDTLFGRGAVHTLDGERHRVRKALFTGLLKDPSAVRDLSRQVDGELQRARPAWSRMDRVVLFDALAKVLTRAVHTWAGCPPGRGRADAHVARPDRHGRRLRRRRPPPSRGTTSPRPPGGTAGIPGGGRSC